LVTVEKHYEEPPINGIATSFQEIPKNISDHAHAAGIFGCSIKAIDSSKGRLSLVMGDLGRGLTRNVFARFKELKGQPPSFVKAYMTAFPECASSNTKRYHDSSGIGMSLMLSTADTMGMRLTLYDGNIRARLYELPPDAQTITEDQVSRVCDPLGFDSGFFYSGEMELSR
jgi:hypothetical protein